VLLAVVAVGGLIAPALTRPWGGSCGAGGCSAASLLLIGCGGLNVPAAALVLLGALHPSGRVGRMALRWHAGVWDLWFLVWGILLAVAAVSYWQRSASCYAG
jgi:hypothetical protein